ncbi:hypothetical protein FGB62_59g024 [Gracilaria domingensis]|nr:hypothetical protein FGB62_59g024 [Gracilaria domingensis]
MYRSNAVFLVISALVWCASSVPPIPESIRNSAPSDLDEITVMPTPTPESRATECVDERYLRAKGYAPHTFVHRPAKLARTLCPPGTLPCATPHHKVLFDGSNLSYEKLCERLQTCEVQHILVNSVYSHVWQPEEHENGAVLTMYDVRYPEMAQKALHWVLRNSRRVIA